MGLTRCPRAHTLTQNEGACVEVETGEDISTHAVSLTRALWTLCLLVSKYHISGQRPLLLQWGMLETAFPNNRNIVTVGHVEHMFLARNTGG